MFKLALGAGHGLRTAGKRCLKSLDRNETREWWLNDRVCYYIYELIMEYDGVSVLRMDDSDDGEDDVAVADRAKAANAWNADLYLSIHHNAGMNGGSGGGIVAFCHPNASSASVQWRDALYAELIRLTGLKGNRAEPLATANFQILRQTAMPAVLLELGFMDSATDVPVILTDAYAKNCAQAIVNVIVARKGLKKKQESTSGTLIYKMVSVDLPVLKKGSKCDAVKTLQILLNSHDFGLAVDGRFGTLTMNAVLEYQEETGLIADGSVGPATWKKILGV